MKDSKYAVGEVVEIGPARVGTVTEVVARDRRWKTSGVRVLVLDNGLFDGHGTTEFLADYLTSRLAPLDWSPVVGGGLEERYVIEAGRSRRELRQIAEVSA